MTIDKRHIYGFSIGTCIGASTCTSTCTWLLVLMPLPSDIICLIHTASLSLGVKTNTRTVKPSRWSRCCRHGMWKRRNESSVMFLEAFVLQFRQDLLSGFYPSWRRPNT